MSWPARPASGPVLSPAGHPPVDQPRVAAVALLRADPEALSHSGPHALDEHVCALDEVQHHGDSRRVLEVQLHARPSTGEQVRLARTEKVAATRTFDADHVGAQVCQRHRRVRYRSDARQLNDLHPPQRAGSLVHRASVAW